MTEKLQKWIQEGTGITKFQYFKNNQEIDEYIQDIKYGRDVPQLCFGVAFDSYSNGKYSYALRYNVSNLNEQM